MKINTRNFGEIEVQEDKVITFESGIPAFEQLKRFVLIEEKDLIISWLQCIDEDVCFPIINPFLITSDYEFEIKDSILEELKVKDKSDLYVYTIVVIPDKIEDIRTNLQGPLIINMKEKLGKQVVLDKDYPVQYKFYKKAGE